MPILLSRVFLPILLLLSVSLSAEQATTIKVTNAEVRQPMQGRSVTAGYLTLHNTSEQSKSLIAVTTEAFQRIELHQHSHKNGVMRMEQVDAINIAAQSEVNLTPGGLHLMLFEPKTKLALGDSIIMQLTFSDQQVISISVPIVALPKR
ncbi:copper chaperone PCu(A)C [Rheinheimera sp. MMS21-TC3]|uniref:copper chaperone PCu(A)C n=1 Tax=Rheinheimera sp. MMS21-TC3 TaxID=3072790 RepID=UPI0028C50F14|nr:copper chaperone PCu(A)C [Rheinheimera sp. MMS21-TC3]WNO60508.1 copper chaperone PCu(A)C [Rheinheimera sp. MMS21-TC3]